MVLEVKNLNFFELFYYIKNKKNKQLLVNE